MKKELIAYKDPKSPVSEMFRTLRTNLQFMNTDDELRTILVTSTLPGEGKSWVSSNLAITLAQTGKKTILVDADMRKGRQYTLFEVSPRPGLSNYLSGVVDDEKKRTISDIIDFVQHTEIDNLDIVSAGNVPPNPSELLVSQKMLRLINRLQEIYDIVIFDGTPSLLVTDAIILSRLVDITLLVTAHKETKIDSLDRVKRTIENVGGKVAGVVVNKLPLSGKKYQDTYYYGSKSKTKKSKNKKEKNIDELDIEKTDVKQKEKEKQKEKQKDNTKKPEIIKEIKEEPKLELVVKKEGFMTKFRNKEKSKHKISKTEKDLSVQNKKDDVQNQSKEFNEKSLENQVFDKEPNKYKQETQETMENTENVTLDAKPYIERDTKQEENYIKPQEENYIKPQEESYTRPQEESYAKPQEENYTRPQGENYTRPQGENYTRPQEENYNKREAPIPKSAKKSHIENTSSIRRTIKTMEQREIEDINNIIEESMAKPKKRKTRQSERTKDILNQISKYYDNQ